MDWHQILRFFTPSPLLPPETVLKSGSSAGTTVELHPLEYLLNFVSPEKPRLPVSSIGPRRRFSPQLAVSAIASILVTLWILTPTLFTKKQKPMFTKRPDKYAAGFINMRNDCFANSSLQAYSSLPSFTEYLNKMLEVYHHTMELVGQLEIDLDEVVDLDKIRAFSHSKFNAAELGQTAKTARDYFKVNLHVAMAKMLSKLNDTQMLTKNLSVWTFLHEIEKIYNARISKSQHDAHELTQLINETLETENIICIRVLKLISEHLQKLPELAPYVLLLQEFPEFPIGGLVILQMKCLTCASVSKPGILPFLMLTLHPPQEATTDLDTLLAKNGSETITEYHCLKCRLSKIIINEDYMKENGHTNAPEEEEIVTKLRECNNDAHLFINEDLPTELEKYVATYKKGGLDILTITSDVFRETHILKPPKVFGIHLSRSAFNGVTLSRNPCRVSFEDKLSLSIEDDYVGDLQKLKLQFNHEANLDTHKTGVLTTDVNDMEHVSTASEDSNFREEVVNEREQDLLNTASSENDDVELELIDNLSLTSETSLNTTIAPSKQETLNSAPISEDQTKNLIKHFGQFKFNENNVYKYRLRALIRHNGSHIQGHYECFKRKPLFVKDSEGNIFKLAPEIDTNLVEEVQELEPQTGDSKDASARNPSADYSSKPTFRNRISSIIARRPSIMQATPTDSNLQEIIDLGIATPSEVLLDGADYFQPPSALDIQNLFDKFAKLGFAEPAPAEKKAPVINNQVKMKKIPSLLRYPYWRIGDTQVQEVSRSAVMFETTSVYMLYYERVDRKQIKR